MTSKVSRVDPTISQGVTKAKKSRMITYALGAEIDAYRSSNEIAACPDLDLFFRRVSASFTYYEEPYPNKNRAFYPWSVFSKIYHIISAGLTNCEGQRMSELWSQTIRECEKSYRDMTKGLPPDEVSQPNWTHLNSVLLEIILIRVLMLYPGHCPVAVGLGAMDRVRHARSARPLSCTRFRR